jgi:hypothetical protein
MRSANFEYMASFRTVLLATAVRSSLKNLATPAKMGQLLTP